MAAGEEKGRRGTRAELGLGLSIARVGGDARGEDEAFFFSV
jgi:hypothetical protein